MKEHTNIHRREFLAWSAAAGLGLATPRPGMGSPLPSAATKPPRTISIFSKQLQWLDYDGMAEVAAEIGFDGVDLTVRPGGHVLPERVEEDLPRAVEAVRRAGLTVPLMATAITDARDPRTEPILRTASALGIGHYRTGYLRYRDELGVMENLKALRPQMRDLAEMNARYRIHGAYQNHAGRQVGGPVWDLGILLRDLDSRWLGCQYDIRHATVEGGTSWPLGLRLLADYIQTTDIKDFLWQRDGQGRWRPHNVPLGEGMVDFDSYFRMVGELNITGPISLHLEYPPFEGLAEKLPPAEHRRQAIAAMQRDLRSLRSMLERAGL